MPTVTDQAIVLRRWDYSETSQTLRLLTQAHGAVRGLAKGAKRPRSNFSGGFDLLTVGEVVYISKSSGGLSNVIGWSLLETNRSLRISLAANRAGIYMADLTHHMVTDEDPHPALFVALRNALRGLAESVPLALLGYQWALLTETGYRPELDVDAVTRAPLGSGRTYAFSASAGGVVADVPGGDRWRVRRTTIELLRRLADGELLEDVASESIDRANRLLAVYARAIMGQALPSMRWAFPELD